jgi:hypothetical protein
MVQGKLKRSRRVGRLCRHAQIPENPGRVLNMLGTRDHVRGFTHRPLQLDEGLGDLSLTWGSLAFKSYFHEPPAGNANLQLAPMHTGGVMNSLFAHLRRRIALTARAAIHSLALLSALFATGGMPAVLVSGSEAESSHHEGSASDYAEMNCDARARHRRPSPHRVGACVFSALSSTSPVRVPRGTSTGFFAKQLSLGLSVPLRC